MSIHTQQIDDISMQWIEAVLKSGGEIPFRDQDKNFPDSSCLKNYYVINGDYSLKAKVLIKAIVSNLIKE